MFPWTWVWSPELNWPLSGAVTQDIEPDVVFPAIVPECAGDADMERRISAVASYGRQLGLLTEVVLDMAEQIEPGSLQAAVSRERLRRIQTAIEAIKDVTEADRVLAKATPVASGSDWPLLDRPIQAAVHNR